jgi:predicted molibdopterin-dependent oxidoreductase YjgC
LCDYGRFSYEKYQTDRVVVPKVRNEDEYLGISTWGEAMDAVAAALTAGGNLRVIASANMTNEEASLAKSLFDRLGAKVDLAVDSIGPIRMKSKFEWLLGTQAAPNYRGVAKAFGLNGEPQPRAAESFDMTGADVLFVLDAEFSEKAKDPGVVAALRRTKYLIVTAWDANHPLCEIADVVLPGATPAEKSGTWTNLQGRLQRIEQAFPPKGQAATDIEILRRIGTRLFADADEFRSASVEALMPVPPAEAATSATAATEA